MIAIYYTPVTTEIESWKSRLDATFTKYEAVLSYDKPVPMIVDGIAVIEGKSAIEEYIANCENFFAGWYEDRCDKHDFFPETDA